jgi:hypothetical protein
MKYRRKGQEFLQPYIQERLDGKLDENGKKPEDLIQWLIDAAPPIEKNVPMLSERVMALNVASIHTTTMVGHCGFVSKMSWFLITFIDLYRCSIHISGRAR